MRISSGVCLGASSYAVGYRCSSNQSSWSTSTSPLRDPTLRLITIQAVTMKHVQLDRFQTWPFDERVTLSCHRQALRDYGWRDCPTRLGLSASICQALCESFDQPTPRLSHGAWSRQLYVSGHEHSTRRHRCASATAVAMSGSCSSEVSMRPGVRSFVSLLATACTAAVFNLWA